MKKRILFVETKWKAHFWNGVATNLFEMDADIEVHWLVSNPAYMKGVQGNAFHHVHQPATATADLPITEDELKKISLSDRMTNFYGARARDFRPVAARIWEILNDTRPHLIIGEATLPVELLCASLARHLGIVYLVPSTCRYPSGRFCLYEYDTYVPHRVQLDAGGLSNQRSPAPAAIVDAIREGRDVPDYMRDVFMSVPRDRIGRVRRYLRQQWLNLRSVVRKDPETASFSSRLRRVCEVYLTLWLWNRVARRRIAGLGDGIPRVLYPLQLQPEANLDVVGWQYREQDRLIRRIVEEIPIEARLLIKPNPKSKCEMNFRLLREVLSDTRYVPLPAKTKMRDLLPQISLVVSVTGTVTLECMAHGIPVVCLGATPDNLFHPVFHPAPFEVLRNSEAWRKQVVPRPVVESFFEWVIRHSFPGEVSDPLNSPGSMRDENLRSIAAAILAAASQAGRSEKDQPPSHSDTSRTCV